MLVIKEEKNGVSIKVTAVPNSSQSLIIGAFEGVLKIKLNSPPIDGKANKEIIAFFSKLINVPKTSIEISKGEKNKLKTLLIKGDTVLLKEKINNIKI